MVAGFSVIEHLVANSVAKDCLEIGFNNNNLDLLGMVGELGSSLIFGSPVAPRCSKSSKLVEDMVAKVRLLWCGNNLSGWVFQIRISLSESCSKSRTERSEPPVERKRWSSIAVYERLFTVKLFDILNWLRQLPLESLVQRRTVSS